MKGVVHRTPALLDNAVQRLAPRCDNAAPYAHRTIIGAACEETLAFLKVGADHRHAADTVSVTLPRKMEPYDQRRCLLAAAVFKNKFLKILTASTRLVE